MREADCLLLDASLEAAGSHRAAEIPAATEADGRAGTMSPTMIDLLNRLHCRKVLAHLRPGSLPADADDPDARGELRRHGIEIAHDGMEIVL
jgi:pyrroloquinoline quinone biosynthesis protein B